MHADQSELTKLTTLTTFWLIKTKLPLEHFNIHPEPFRENYTEKSRGNLTNSFSWDRKEYIFITKASQCFHTKPNTSHILDVIFVCRKKTEPISCLLLGGPSLRIFNQRSVRKENDLPLCPRLSSWLARLLAIIIIIQSQCLTSEKLKFTNGRLKM